MGHTIGKLVYGSTFMVVLPVLLILWASATETQVQLPLPSNNLIITFFIGAGIALMTAAMANLWLFGRGLPMNAYPPKLFVTKGAYQITSHPIYLAAIMLSFAIAALLKSAAGFWLVSPLFTLLVVAYTVGFENERTQKVFGLQNHKPFLSLPSSSSNKANFRERAGTFFLVFVPWFFVYEAFILIGAPQDAVLSNLPIDAYVPFIEFSVIFYLLSYPFAIAIIFVVKTKDQLRHFAFDVWLATALSGLAYLCLPFVVEQKSFQPTSVLGNLLLLDRQYDAVSAALPAFHVTWALLSGKYFTKAYPKARLLWWLISLLICISCLTTGNHSLADVIAAILIYVVVHERLRLWAAIRLVSEKMANSWKEWRFGEVRLINHGFYAGAAAFTGALLIGCIVPPPHSYAGFLLGLVAIVGAGLWAQLIEGSPRLQRPYGYYGSVAAVGFCCLILLALGADFYLLVGAAAFAAPWVQVIGRLRCLVQGCCHGRPAPKWLGIRFTQSHSRVNKISGLNGAYVHPTQLYSIAANILIGFILIRLHTLNMNASFITGIYLLLNGLARFVEEYYRGESQTPYWAGMRIYQWIAVINMVTGAIFTCLPSVVLPSPMISSESILGALVLGIIAIAAYGVDFPNSTRRFARLTSE